LRFHKLNSKIYFQSFNAVFVFDRDKFDTVIHTSTAFKYSFLVDQTLYIQQLGKGLHKLIDNHLELIDLPELFSETEIWSVFKLDNGDLLIGTQFNGFYIFDGINTKPWESEANRYILANNLFSSLHMRNGNFVFGSIQDGLIITDKTGKIQTILNTVVGLQNNTVLSLFEDESENVWVGLDNGIDYVKTNSPFSYVRRNGGFGTGYTSIVRNNILYTGTNQGLYYVTLDEFRSDYLAESNFEMIENTRGQVWCLCLVNNQLFCGHNSGLYIIKDTQAKKIGEIMGVWDVKEIPGNLEELLIGTYEGFYLLNKNNFNIRKVKGFNESSRRFLFDSKNNIVLSHGYKGVFYLKPIFDIDSIASIEFFNGSKYLPAYYGNEIYRFNNEIITIT
jgi:ligand-binding sensor domain-containing protein